MDMVTVNGDGTFDTGAQPVATGAGMTEICRIPNKGHRALLSVLVAGGTIGDIQILQSAFTDDPNPQVVCDGTGFNSPALANESYVIPALTFPFEGTFQVHTQGDGMETIIKANNASAGGVTVRVRGIVRSKNNG